MSVFELAKEKERRMAELYRGLATDCKNPSVKGVLTMLAEQEARHYDMVSAIQDQVIDEPEIDIVGDAKEIFQKIKEQKSRLTLNSSQLEVYREVKSFEKENEDFYRAKAKEANDPELRDVLNKFADEEHRHFLLMSELVDFVERPDQWIENAEFNHIDEY